MNLTYNADQKRFHCSALSFYWQVQTLSTLGDPPLVLVTRQLQRLCSIGRILNLP